MKRSKTYALVFLIMTLTYAWLMMVLSLMLVELVIMNYIGNSALRSILGIGVYVALLAIWYFSIKCLIERKIRLL